MNKLFISLMVVVFCFTGCGAKKKTQEIVAKVTLPKLRELRKLTFQTNRHSEIKEGDYFIFYVSEKQKHEEENFWDNWYSYTLRLEKFSLESIGKRLDALELLNKYVGEYYKGESKYLGYGSYADFEWKWHKFVKKQINDSVDGFTKIGNVWIPNACIIYYKEHEFYKDEKQAIEKIAEKEYEKVKSRP